MRREELYRLTLRVLAITFAIGALIFSLAPGATVEALNATGEWFGDFAPAPTSEARLWVTLAVAYMVLVALIAWIAQRDLRRHRQLLVLLAVGKGSSSLLALLYYWLSTGAFVQLANFAVDGAIALAAIGMWAGVPSLDARGPAAPGRGPRGLAGSGREARILGALLEALVPGGGAFPEGASGGGAEAAMRKFVAASGGTTAFRLFLWLLELSPFALPPIWLRRFSRLSLGDRVRLLQAWEESRLWPRRQALHTVKLAALAQFYARPEIHARLGYPDPLERVPPDDAPAPGVGPR